MKKIIALVFFTSIIGHAFAQQTFTSKKEALEFLKEAFSKNFIKTPVIINSSKKEISFDYKINEDHIVIIVIEKTGSNESEKWITIPYTDRSSILPLKKNEVFNKIGGIVFIPSPLFYTVSRKEYKRINGSDRITSRATFPFEYNKNDLINSIGNAMNTVAKANEAADEAAKKIADDTQQKENAVAQKAWEDFQNEREKIKGARLAPYKVFTVENTEVNLYAYLLEKRAYKTKPSLLITWADWCKSCSKQIDTLLSNGLGLKYNIILLNKEQGTVNLAKLIERRHDHNPDYTKDAILLFDKNGQLKEIDNDSVPFFLWLDKNLKVIGLYHGWDITTASIIKKLEEIKY